LLTRFTRTNFLKDKDIILSMTDPDLEAKLRVTESQLALLGTPGVTLEDVDRLASAALDYAGEHGIQITENRRSMIAYPLARAYLEAGKEILRDMNAELKKDKRGKRAEEVFGMIDRMEYYDEKCDFSLRAQKVGGEGRKYLYKQAADYALDVVDNRIGRGGDANKQSAANLFNVTLKYMRRAGVKVKKNKAEKLQERLIGYL
jgi:hypothetical protein